jgi:hypothetical protein
VVRTKETRKRRRGGVKNQKRVEKGGVMSSNLRKRQGARK